MHLISQRTILNVPHFFFRRCCCWVCWRVLGNIKYYNLKANQDKCVCLWTIKELNSDTKQAFQRGATLSSYPLHNNNSNKMNIFIIDILCSLRCVSTVVSLSSSGGLLFSQVTIVRFHEDCAMCFKAKLKDAMQTNQVSTLFG